MKRAHVRVLDQPNDLHFRGHLQGHQGLLGHPDPGTPVARASPSVLVGVPSDQLLELEFADTSGPQGHLFADHGHDTRRLIVSLLGLDRVGLFPEKPLATTPFLGTFTLARAARVFGGESLEADLTGRPLENVFLGVDRVGAGDEVGSTRVHFFENDLLLDLGQFAGHRGGGHRLGARSAELGLLPSFVEVAERGRNQVVLVFR